MSYASRTDLELVMEPEAVAQLSDDTTGALPNDDIVTRCIADADGVIDSYCEARYVVPFATVPGVVRNASTTIAHYLLCLRRGWTVSEKVKAAHDDVMSWLKDVSDSVAGIPGAVSATSSASSWQADERIFTRDNMKSFI